MTTEKDEKKTGVARLRELFYDKKRKVKPSPELREVFKKEKTEKQSQDEANRKVARPRDSEAGI